MICILYWDRNGFCLWQKRLERHRFRWPDTYQNVLKIDGRELSLLLEGLDLRATKGHGRLSYTSLSKRFTAEIKGYRKYQ